MSPLVTTNKRTKFGPEDEKPFREWLTAKNPHPSWPLDDIARIATHGSRGDDDLNVIFAADDLWYKFYHEVNP